MHPPEDLDPLAEAFLFQADRAQHFKTKIIPALKEGKVVITDRCFDSSMVYQGFVKGAGVSLTRELSALAMRQMRVDLTILLDIAPLEVCKRRLVDMDRFDRESLRFHEDVRHGFLAQAKAYPSRIKVIDATQSTKEVHKQVIKLVEGLLKSREDGNEK
jgi:dTMP kinase